MIQRVDTRALLLTAAIDVVSREGVDAASLRTICARVGVQLPTLYHYFGDKQGLLDAVVDACFERYLAGKRRLRPTGDPRVDLRRGWDLHVGFAREHPAVYPLMFPPGGDSSPTARRSFALLRDGFAKLAADGVLREGVSAELATRSLSSALRGVASAVAREPTRRDNTRQSAIVRDAVIDALLATEAT